MNTTEDIKYMTEALIESKKAKLVGDLPFGAIVVCNGEIVGRGKSENGTTGDVTDHAELLALRRACRTLRRNELQDCKIYCTNEPCAMCSAAIFQAKIPQVIVGLLRSDLPQLLRPRNIHIQDLANDSGYEIQITTGVMKHEILEVFEGVVRK